MVIGERGGKDRSVVELHYIFVKSANYNRKCTFYLLFITITGISIVKCLSYVGGSELNVVRWLFC